jgi:DNA-binding transcriptional LysR family regulator
MVAINLGIAILPRTICKELDPAKIKTVSLAEPMVPWHLGMIWKKDRYLSFASRSWLKLTSQYFGIKLDLP